MPGMDLAKILHLTPEARRARMEALAWRVTAALVEEAPDDPYRDCIQNPEIFDDSALIRLKSPATLREEARPARDMRDWLLLSPKARFNRKGGKYLRIPFKDGDIRTVSSSGKPWWQKATPGVGTVGRVLAKMPELISETRLAGYVYDGVGVT